MYKKNVQECLVLDKKEISQNKLIQYFMEYGNLITINICNNKVFEGIITFGKWQDSIKDKKSWINKECKVLYDGGDQDSLYKKADTIFKQNSIIRTIPVLNKQNELVANIERFDTLRELEESLLEDIWESLLYLANEDELKSEFEYLRSVIKRAKYKLIGRNYLSEQFRELFGLESTTDSGQLSVNRGEFDFIIDMDISYKFVRKHYAENWYQSVYSCDEFLNEILCDVSFRRYTKWKYCTSGEYCDLDMLLKSWGADNIFIQKDRIMFKEYNTYLCSHNYSVKYIDKAGFYMSGINNGINYTKKKMPVEDAVYLENQLVKLNLYFNNLEKKVHVFNFSILGNVELNSIEKQRFENCGSIDDIYIHNYEELEEFFGDSYDVNEWVNEIRGISKKWVRGRGIVASNLNLNSLTYYNYIRYTANVPLVYQNTIYFFGVCTAEGLLTKDEDTIESLLQKMINDIKKPYRVINLGNTSPDSIERMIKGIDFEEGDIIITILFSATDKIRETIPIIDITQAFRNLDENRESLFFDLVAHCNARANEKMAAYILKYLTPLLITREKIERKKHSLYTIFNNDNDIEWVEKEVKKYILSIEAAEKRPDIVRQNNGAIVMNANPFSKGHLYLVEKASQKCDTLFLFVLEEDSSYFSFRDRIAMVKKGTEHLSNVIVVPSGKYIISQQTFPGYFQKDKCWDEKNQLITGKMDSSVDVRIFGKYIAKFLGIKKRFVGDEKFDMITEEYNNALNILLPRYGVQVDVIERKTLESGTVISASLVRRALNSKDWKTVLKLVPNSTFNYLVELYSQ